MPAPSKLTPAVQKLILSYIAGGAFVETAVVSAGIGKSTYYDWIKKGAEQKSGKYRTFKDLVDQAVAKSELTGAIYLTSLSRRTLTKAYDCSECGHANTVSVPVPDNVALAATQWRLQRQYPDHYGGKLKVELEGEVALKSGLEMLHGALADKHDREDAGGD